VYRQALFGSRKVCIDSLLSCVYESMIQWYLWINWFIVSYFEFDGLIGWLRGSLSQWFTDSLIFSPWLLRWFIVSLIPWLPDLQTHWFTDSPLHWFIQSSAHWFICSLFHWQIESLLCCLFFTGSLIRWFMQSSILGSLFHVSLIYWSAVFLIRWFVESSIHGFIAALISCICWFIDSLILW
jgi:hypothetical protein